LKGRGSWWQLLEKADEDSADSVINKQGRLVDVRSSRRLVLPLGHHVGMNLTVAPVDVGRWPDVETLFGGNGAYGGCWCMFWRLTNQQISGKTSDDHRESLRDMVASGLEPGLIFYDDGAPMAWASLGPRPDYARLFRTKGIAPGERPSTDDDPDDRSIWSIPCVYVGRSHRKQGISSDVVEAALRYAKSKGASTVEGYPVAEPPRSTSGLATGTVGMFVRAGFTVYREPSVGRRVVMRHNL
jgi:GNAT superfamily N-acetyltransferase